MSALSFGSFVTINLGSPREQVFGITQQLDASGLLVRSISVDGLDDWFRSVARQGESESEEPMDEIRLALTFFPMHRVERIVVDEPIPGLSAVHERFAERVGLPLREWASKHYPDLQERGE